MIYVQKYVYIRIPYIHIRGQSRNFPPPKSEPEMLEIFSKKREKVKFP